MKLFHSCKRLLLLLLICFNASMIRAQTSPVVSSSGYSIWESVSLSAPLSGQPFTYNIFFTLPAGASNFTITAYLPAEIVIDAITGPAGPASYSGNPYVLTPLLGNDVRLTFPSPIVGNISGSFQVHAHFPYLNACNRTVATNVELKGAVSLRTADIPTDCVVDKTWHLQKYSVGTTYVGGTGCNYQKVDSTIEYGVRIVRSSSQIWGSYSLNVGALTDVPPSGGVVLNGFTYLSPSLSGSTLSGGSFSLAPAVLDPASAYEMRFRVQYNVSGCLRNGATLTGTNGCGDDVTFTDTAKVAIVKQLPDSSRIVKSVVTAGNLPGCTGTYTIRVYNYGSSPVNYVLRDTFPVCLGTSVASAIVPPGGSFVNFTSGPPSVAVMHGVSLAGFGASHAYTFTFTIGTGCASSFTNTVRVDSGFAGSSSATVNLLPPGAKPCIKKTICGNTYLFNVGDTVRFRLRVQNIGGTPITGGIVTDSLDINNLSYIGNEMHYFANSAAVNYACKPTLTPLTGPGPYQWGSFTSSYSPASGAITWLIPEVPVQCSNIPNPVCESAWNAPAYYIEFDVKIKDTAGIGNVFNKVMIDGGNIVAPATGFVSIITKGYINYGASKEVSADNVTYGASASAGAGSVVYYKLVATNYGIAIRNATLVDLLPTDNNLTDNFILWNGNRSPGGSFKIIYNGPVSSSHTTTADNSSTATGIKTTTELGVTVNGNAPGWVPSLVPGSANIKTLLTQQIGSTLPLNYKFSAKIAGNAKVNDIVCNSYALRGYAKYLQNAAVNYMLLGALESSSACVTAKEGDPCCKPYGFKIPTDLCQNKSAQFCVLDSCREGSNTYYWDFGDGSPVQTGNCVTYAYTSTGPYTVIVKWKNACGEYSSDKYEVNVEKCPCCKPDGFNIPKEICFGSSAQFCVLDSCKEGSNTYYWDFGDGSAIQTGKCVTHAYTTPGTYYVVVKWRNECGEYSTDKYEVNVKECPCKINVAFTLFAEGYDMIADASGTVSAQPIAAYVWDYGDGTFGTGAVSSHHYTTPGVYTVTLTVYTMGPNGDICECRGRCRTEIRIDSRRRNRATCGDRDGKDEPAEKKAADEITMNATPNPFRDRVSVNFTVPAAKVQQAQAYSLSLMSAGGNVMQTKALKSLNSTASFETAKYSTGVYYLMLRGADNQVKSVKVVKIN